VLKAYQGVLSCLNKWREDIKVRVKKSRDNLVDSFIGENQVIKREEFFHKIVKSSFEFTNLALRGRIDKALYVSTLAVPLLALKSQ
jgi:hypothetical protein